jgi:deoxyribonuclease-4
MSIAGGVHTAFRRGTAIGCATMQVFTKNSNQWEAKPLSAEEIENYKRARANATIDPVVSHAAYLINLCAVNPAVLNRSRAAFEDELRRSETFGMLGVVVHPGAHMGAGEPAGVMRIAESLNLVHARTPGFRTLTILETTAGQGSSIGYRFEHLRGILDQIECPERIAFCIDTCHLFAAGYSIHTEEGWENTVHELDTIVGLHRVVAVHVNDSKKGAGSRVDRHEHIGKGLMGSTPFRLLMNDLRFSRIPKILETEKSDDMHEDVENMEYLVRLMVHTGKDKR